MDYDDLATAASTLLRVHSRRDELMQKELIYEWEQNASVPLFIDQKRKKRKRKKRIFKGLPKRGRMYTISGVYCDDGSLFLIYRDAFMIFGIWWG